jgi:hypothetical protein
VEGGGGRWRLWIKGEKLRSIRARMGIRTNLEREKGF